MFCSKCGSNVADNQRFCSACGNDLGASDLDATVLAPQPEAIASEGLFEEATVMAERPIEPTVMPQAFQEPLPPVQKGKKPVAGIIIGVVAAIIVVVGAILAFKFIPNKQTEAEESSSKTTAVQKTEKTTEAVEVQEADVLYEKAIKAYEQELLSIGSFDSVYVVDINADNIPEVIYQPEFAVEKWAITYTEKHGLSKICFTGHSSMPPAIYISNDNCIYMRDDGHNVGTAFYHYAAVYKIDETGFVLVGEVEGDEPTEEIEWEDQSAFNELTDKYDELFRQKLVSLIGGKHFSIYTDVANTQNLAEYLKDELSIVLPVQSVDVRQVYEDYLNSAVAQKYYEVTTDNDMYFGNEYSGRETYFADIDGDSTEECLLTVSFPSDESLSYEMVYIFDIEQENVTEVYSSWDCGSHRSQQKFALIENNGSYLVHCYYTDPHMLWGTVYSYNGSGLDVVWSYECDITNPEKTEDHIFLTSGVCDLSGEFVMSEYTDSGILPENVIEVSLEDFYSTYNSYVDAAIKRIP